MLWFETDGLKLVEEQQMNLYLLFPDKLFVFPELVFLFCCLFFFLPSLFFFPKFTFSRGSTRAFWYMNGNSIYYTKDLITLKCKLGFCLYVHMEKQTLRSFSSYYCVLCRLLLVINISYGYLQLMLLLHQISLFSFLSVIYGCHCTDCGMFQCIFSFCMLLFLFFIAGGFGFAHERVIFVSLCNIHFSISATFYLDRESRVFFFVWFCQSW